jgi:plasmid stabilization system protein ParE
MGIEIRWSPSSVADLEDICRFISRDSDYYARMFVQKMLSVIETIPSFPESGRMVPEYQHPDIREKVCVETNRRPVGDSLHDGQQDRERSVQEPIIQDLTP